MPLTRATAGRLEVGAASVEATTSSAVAKTRREEVHRCMFEVAKLNVRGREGGDLVKSRGLENEVDVQGGRRK